MNEALIAGLKEHKGQYQRICEQGIVAILERNITKDVVQHIIVPYFRFPFDEWFLRMQIFYSSVPSSELEFRVSTGVLTGPKLNILKCYVHVPAYAIRHRVIMRDTFADLRAGVDELLSAYPYADIYFVLLGEDLLWYSDQTIRIDKGVEGLEVHVL